VGRSFARALARVEADVVLLSGRGPWPADARRSALIILAVPDDGIANVAAELGGSGIVTPDSAVLHTSGLCDRSVLSALDATGAALGSIHPLQSFADPQGDPDALCAAPAVIEGDSRAIIVARELALTLGMPRVIEIAGERKPLYHAGAVFASNYLVVLADIAVRLMHEAGVAGADVDLLLPLMRQTLDNLAQDQAGALTGPVRRGDVGTVTAHLAALGEPERALYRLLALEALPVAVAAGLPPERVDAMRMVLDY
jgi:predicted short-subunit dehydrogenase-like oxidoreductase (DUF2520 family)